MSEPLIISDYKFKKLRKALQDIQNSVHEHREEMVETLTPESFESMTETLDEIRTLLDLGEFKYTGEHDGEAEAEDE